MQNGYETYIRGAQFTDAQVERLRRIKDVFLAALQERGEIDVQSILGNPIYEQIIGSFDEVNRLFDGRLADVVAAMQENFHLPRDARAA